MFSPPETPQKDSPVLDNSVTSTHQCQDVFSATIRQLLQTYPQPIIRPVTPVTQLQPYGLARLFQPEQTIPTKIISGKNKRQKLDPLITAPETHRSHHV